MLEANTQFSVTPALNMVSHYEEAHYILMLENCVSQLLITLQKIMSKTPSIIDQTQQNLVENYLVTQKNFIAQTESMLVQVINASLMEASFDIGVLSKLKIAKKFFLKAEDKWNCLTATEDTAQVIQHFFHYIVTALIYSIDVHVDVMRTCESAMHAYERQAVANEETIGTLLANEIKQAETLMNQSKKHFLHFRDLLVEANLNLNQNNILINIFSLLREYLNTGKLQVS